MLTPLDKITYQKEEVIITGYDKASGMEFRADRIHPLKVEINSYGKQGGKW
jgi:cell fate (sporulation/competence/biofilm development) regulator YmcA (YheA/YmcA/DUF963 family)